jgi:hypothetical protein
LKKGSSKKLSEVLVDDLISSFGGCLPLYKIILNSFNEADELMKMKINHTENLKFALDLNNGQTFSNISLERYELLQAIAKGEKIHNLSSQAARYLLAKHGEIEAILGIHPDGHLVLALPMTMNILKQIEDNKALSVYITFMRYIGWIFVK